MCISILKMSYKFVTQFEATQHKLKKKTGIFPTYGPPQSDQLIEDYNLTNGKEDDAPVEIIFGEQKFNLKDLLIVEEPEKEYCNFKGFLKNLGQEVSATFADKSNNKIAFEELNEDAVSIYMSLNENNVLPVKELKIDGDTNTINCIILEENDFKEETEENDNIEYIEIETSDKDIESFIVKIEEDSNEKDKENEETVPKQEIKRPTKRKKIIKERISDGMIIMEPLNGDKQMEKPKFESEDDIFEREIQFPCELCKKIYPTKRSLRAHINRTHFPKPCQYTCEICGYQNNTRSGISIFFLITSNS